MTYLEQILQKQNSLARKFFEQVLPVPETTAVFPKTADGGTDSEQQDPEIPTRQNDPSKTQTLYEKWSELSLAVEKIRTIRMDIPGQSAKSAEEEFSSALMRTDADSQQGGTVSAAVSHLESSGIAGYRTRQSMAEISRFFERDARRYGGNGWQ